MRYGRTYHIAIMSSPSHLLYTAQYVVNTAHELGAVTPMKLQKLLYYAQTWGLMEEQDLVGGSFEKWPYGPVNRAVYQGFKAFGASDIAHQSVPMKYAPVGRRKELLDFIVFSYAPFSPISLSKMTHDEAPWREAEMGAVITEDAMRAFVKTHPFRVNFPFDPQKPYVAVPSNASAAFALDMSRREAEQSLRHASYESYLAQLRAKRPWADPPLSGLFR